MNFAIVEKNSNRVIAIVDEPLAAWFAQNFPIYDQKEIISVGGTSFVTSQVIQEIIRNTCFKCGGLMKDGQAIQNGKLLVSSYDSAVGTYQGVIEYPDVNNHSVIKVRKCTVCGHSHT